MIYSNTGTGTSLQQEWKRLYCRITSWKLQKDGNHSSCFLNLTSELNGVTVFTGIIFTLFFFANFLVRKVVAKNTQGIFGFLEAPLRFHQEIGSLFIILK
jgi:hypothetical protein